MNARRLSTLIPLLLVMACDPHAYLEESATTTRGKVTLGVIHHNTSTPSEESDRNTQQHRTFKNEHIELQLEQFALTIADIELHACSSQEKIARITLPPLIPSAHAHVPESSTRLGTPTVEDLLARAGKATILGEVAPPLGHYCKLRVILAPADDDVINLNEQIQTSEMLNHVIWLKGKWRPLGSEAPQWTSFEYKTTTPLAVEVLLDEPINLTKQKSSAFVLIDKPLGEELVNALEEPLSEQTPSAIQGALTRYLEQQLKRYKTSKK